MNIINRKTIVHYTQKYPKAKNQLLTWYNEMLKQEFDNFNELKAVYGNASIINNQRVVFNHYCPTKIGFPLKIFCKY